MLYFMIIAKFDILLTKELTSNELFYKLKNRIVFKWGNDDCEISLLSWVISHCLLNTTYIYLKFNRHSELYCTSRILLQYISSIVKYTSDS